MKFKSAFVLVVVALAVAGCGSSGGSTSSTTAAGPSGTTGSSSDASDLNTEINTPDQALAESLVLKAGDLGAGWTQNAVPKPYSQKQPKCPAYGVEQSDLTITGHAETNFSYDPEVIQVDSDVEVLQSAAQVATDVSRIYVAQATQCIGYRALQSGEAAGYTVGPATLLPFPKYGDALVAYRVIFHSPKTGAGYVTYDVINFTKGRAMYSLNVVAADLPATQTHVAQAERSIVSRLVARSTA